jgi:unsaturated rhamnogalacturonyl hydrolase
MVGHDEAGRMTLEKIVAVSGLGGKQQRNGSFDYYVSEPVVANDYKGVGPFIMAGLELGKAGGR